jgi:hypothetical protein
MFANTSLDDPSISLTKEGNGIDNLDKSYKMLEPWQLLNDLGHFASYNYSYLLKILEDFNSRYAELQNKAIKFGEGVAKKYITANAKSHRTAEKLFDEGLRRGQEAANAYIIEQFRNSENNTTNTSNFNMNTSTRVRELNEERNANYINEIYIILGYKKR